MEKLGDSLGDSIIRTQWQDKKRSGGCNFCTRNTEKIVLIVKSNDDLRSLEVRFCPKCFEDLCKQGKKR